MQEHNNWILEISYKDKLLSMSLYEKELVCPIRSVSTIAVNFSRIESLHNEIIAIVNRANRKRVLDNDSISEFKKNAQFLYDILLTRQIKNQLSSLGSVNLILSLDQRLITIPWELLFDGKDFLCLKFNLSRSIQMQNPEIMPEYRSIQAKPRMLVLANPTGDLKSAYQEGVYIKNYLVKKDKIKVDFKSQDIDSNYLRQNLREYDIVHFAGHCEYDTANSGDSAWVLSDGEFSAREFLALGQSISFPSIIFANACQSAHSANSLLDSQTQSNVFGFAQAFLFAGVRHYLGSFWRIEDDFSWEFAEEFYNQLVNSKPIAEAVRLARLRLFRKYGISAVAWAGYVLYGDPAFVLFKTHLASELRLSRKVKQGIHAAKFRMPVFSGKKLVFLSLALAVLVLGVALVNRLPTLNPNAYMLFSKAAKLYTEGDNNEAIGLLNQTIKENALYLSAWRLRGDVYFRLGKFHEALSDYFDYARFSEKRRQYRHLATAYIKIAWTYHMWGDYKRSQEFYQKALDLSKSRKDKLNEADALARMAVWYIDKGDNESAFSLLMKSSEINRGRQRNPEHRFNLACDYFNIAFLYFDRDDYIAAKDFFNKSKQIFQGLGAVPELSDYYFDMGEIAFFEKKYDLALDFYQKGLALDKKLNHRFNLSSDYWMLGEFFWETGKLKQAEEYFKEAISLCREIDNKPVLAGVYYDLGLMYKEMGRSQDAEEYLAQALRLYKNIDTPDYQEVQQEYLALK